MSKFSPKKCEDFSVSNGERVVADPGGPSLTRQEFKEECDINTIMARYEVTGALPGGAREPVYVDWTYLPNNLMDMMARLDEAQAAFMTLPAVVRKEFDNNAHLFVDFASDPQNLDQMRVWGLAPAAKAPEAAPAAPAAAPAQASGTPGQAPQGPSAHGST